MIETIITAVISFIGTNIDDIFINTFFFAGADTKQKVRNVVIGKYLGIGTLVAVSMLAAFGLRFIPQEYIKWLGIVPIVLGIKAVFDTGDNESKTAANTLGVALITMANGADNIGVYIPLFAGYSVAKTVVTVSVFALMTALWCILGKKLSSLLMLKAFLQKYKGIIVPIVFISLGLYILIAR